MDGTAISAVPVAKAGMAAGLFNTVRVAGEGSPGGRLRGINGKQYPDPAESRSRVCPEVIHRAAGWLGAGNMPQAAALLPDFSSGRCARAMTLLIRYCLAGWRSSPCCAP